MDRKRYNSCTWFELITSIKASQKSMSDDYDKQLLLFREQYWLTFLPNADPKFLKNKTPEDLWPIKRKKEIKRKTKPTPVFVPIWKDKNRLEEQHKRFNPTE